MEITANHYPSLNIFHGQGNQIFQCKSPAIFWMSFHKDVTLRLAKQNRGLYQEVRRILQVNKEERHLRGGMATRRKYHPEPAAR